ncbi:unnamed protein product [Rotaria socialis]|uniref:peptide-O-fucosyltransferase n=1 Tax=Rotaria socialis TaxID=392032 RepID=A0A818G6W7_9BILA|nr:unnamed protein product [Rotaria socialis]
MAMLTITLYLNNRTQFSRFHWRETHNRVKQILANNTSTISSRTSTQYLWCVNHYGPNNQLRDFIKCGIIAMLNKYILVIPPFYPHYGQSVRGIQWFDHFFDLKQLRQVINFITLDEFIEKIKINQKTVMIDCYIQQYELVRGRMWYSKNALIPVQNYFKINIDFHRSMNLTNNFQLYELFSKSKNCSSIFLHIHYMMFRQFFSNPNNYTKKIFEFLRRTPLLQRMASQLISQLPKLAIRKNRSQINFRFLAVVHIRIGDHVVMSLSMYIKQILYLINDKANFTHLHIMCPYLNSTDMKQLTDSLSIPFTTSRQLLNHMDFVLDPYLFDVLEQEIAYQAPIFIASPWTTYSATILMQKVYQQKGTVYVLSTVKDKHPTLVTKQNAKYFDK